MRTPIQAIRFPFPPPRHLRRHPTSVEHLAFPARTPRADPLTFNALTCSVMTRIGCAMVDLLPATFEERNKRARSVAQSDGGPGFSEFLFLCRRELVVAQFDHHLLQVTGKLEWDV